MAYEPGGYLDFDAREAALTGLIAAGAAPESALAAIGEQRELQAGLGAPLFGDVPSAVRAFGLFDDPARPGGAPPTWLAARLCGRCRDRPATSFDEACSECRAEMDGGEGMDVAGGAPAPARQATSTGAAGGT